MNTVQHVLNPDALRTWLERRQRAELDVGLRGHVAAGFLSMYLGEYLPTQKTVYVTPDEWYVDRTMRGTLPRWLQRLQAKIDLASGHSAVTAGEVLMKLADVTEQEKRPRA